jgi:adenylate cyclase
MSGKAPKSSNRPPAAHTGDKPPHEHVPHFLGGFLDKLKRRNVGRVAILYIVVCYLILEPFEMFFHLLDLPVWTGRTAVALMVLGFPVALLLAWIYEITPTGIKPSVEVDPNQSIARQTGRKLDRAIIAVLAVALTYFVADKFWISKRVAVIAPTAAVAPPAVSTPASPVVPEKSVAVLPFVDMSEKKDQEYFSDGLSEELIDMLTKVPELRVPARTSSFYFKGKQATIADIAKSLAVAHVLEGSVRKSGNTLRITAQLIRADSGYHVWSETFDRKPDNLFKVQDEIAYAVVKALKVSLLPQNRLDDSRTPSVEANDLYLQAKFLLSQSTESSIAKGVDLTRKAIMLAPDFARAWALLSRGILAQAGHGLLAASQVTAARAEARRAAEKAVSLDPALEDGHIALAKVYQLIDQDTEKSISELQRALELNPRSSDALIRLSLVAIVDPAAGDRIRLAERAVEIDPLDSSAFESLGEAYLFAGQYRQAEASLRKARDLSNDNMFASGSLGILMLLRGEPATALAEFDRFAKSDDDRLWVRALVYPALGRTAEADAALKALEGSALAREWPVQIAEIYTQRRQFDKAFEWLDRQYHLEPSAIPGDPLLKPLETDPRYKAFLKKMNLPG